MSKKNVRIGSLVGDIFSLLRLFEREWSREDDEDMHSTMSAIHMLSKDICHIIEEVDE